MKIYEQWSTYLTVSGQWKQVLSRMKRGAGGGSGQMCKYKKGEWSACDKLTWVTQQHHIPHNFQLELWIIDLLKLISREDSLKEKHSSSSCNKNRTVTKNCKKRDGPKKNESMLTNPQMHFHFPLQYNE